MYSSFLDTTFGEKCVDDDSDVCIIWVPSSAAEGGGAPPSLVQDPRVYTYMNSDILKGHFVMEKHYPRIYTVYIIGKRCGDGPKVLL